MTADQYLDQFYTEDEAAKILGISARTLRNRIYAGKPVPPYTEGHVRRFPKDAFHKWHQARIVKDGRRAS